MRKKTFFRRILAMTLSVAIVLGGVPATAIASAPPDMSLAISVFKSLPEETAAQEVELGATLSDIILPEALEAVLGTEGLPQDADSGQAEHNHTDYEQADSDQKQEISGEELEETGQAQFTVSIPVAWDADPVFNGEVEGTYVFEPSLPAEYTLDTGAETPSITVTVKDGSASESPVPLELSSLDGMMTLMSTDNSSWQQVGSNVLNSGAYDTSMVVSGGVPYVSVAGGSSVTVWKGNGTTWVKSREVSTNGIHTSLSIDTNGRYYVAFSNPSATDDTMVHRYNTSWTSLGAPVPVNDLPKLRASNISLSIAEDGTPYMAANQTSMSSRVSVTKYNGSAWEYVGSPSIAGEETFSASMDVYQGTPYVAYCIPDSSAYGSYVTMKKYSGSQWETVGNKQISVVADKPYVTSAAVSMKISDNGTPYVAYAEPGTQTDSKKQLMVKKLSYGSWVTVGSGYLTAGEASYISLYVEGETSYVAYKDGSAASTAGVTVKKFDNQNNSWIPLGNTAITDSSNAKGISLFVENGIPYVSYSTSSNVKVMKFAAPPKQAATIIPGATSVTYAGAAINLATVSGLFTVDSGAGARTYTLETPPSEGGGEGLINNGTTLSVTKAGAFRIGLATAESDTHTAGSKAIATLTVEKGVQNAPSGLGAANASSSSASDGKITGLTNGIAYEYKLVGGSSYTNVTASASGEINNLPVGSYVVRRPETPLYNPSADSTQVTIGDATSLTYSATINPTSYTFAAATVNYAQQAEQQFTITNTGTGTITGLSASLNNANFTITNMVIVSQITPNGTATISVRPKTGLAAGTHTGTLTITGMDGISLTTDLSFTVNKIQTTNSLKYGSTYSYVYNATPWELIHWINFGPSDGKRIYTLENGTTGQGFFNGSQLHFTSSGTFVAGIVTEETAVYAQTPKIYFTMNITKGTIPAPNIAAVNATAGESNGKITGLMVNKECEYKIAGASSYNTATTNAYGQITDLPTGTYVVRYPDNDLHAASPDSNTVTIGENALTYTAAVSPLSHTFTAAKLNYTQQAEQQFTITNTGTGTISGLTASLDNGDFTITNMVIVSQIAPNQTATINVRPKTGLAIGTHTGTLTITGNNDVSVNASLTFIVNKGDQSRPEGLGAENATVGKSDGKIVGLAPGMKYEYRLSSEEDYLEVIADANGQITGIPAGEYQIRFAATEQYNASPDSNAVTIGEDALTYTAALSSTSYTFTAAKLNYTQQAEQQFTITNTGTGTISGLTASLNNADFTITNMVIVSQIAPNETASISVRPKTGLAVGTHTGTLTIIGYDNVSVNASVTFIVNKGDQSRPEGFGAENTTTGKSDGKIIGLTPGTKYEYRLSSEEDYREATADANGQIAGLPAGEYRIRFAATDQYNASPDSEVIAIGERKGSGGSGGNSPSPSSPGEVAAVIVNGESKTAGTAQTATGSDGRTTTTVTVDSGRLESILASEKRGATVIIPVAGKADAAAGVLTGQMVKTMENQAAVLVIRTDSANYTLPASEINISAVSQQLGTKVELKDITVAVSIAEPSGQMTSVVENASRDGGFTLMVPSVEYTAICSYGGKTVKVSNFNTYVERMVAIPSGVDPEKITTGIVVNPDGTIHHVPTQVTVINGRYYAVINSLTNSTYSVIWNPIEFADMSSHWAKASGNNMGSRMVVNGVGNGNYEPDRNMTRAEFAAVMVRALGLAPEKGGSSFGDVVSSQWYCGYIKTAAAYGIVKGYSDSAFGPSDTITREQAMTMIARAMEITGLNAELANDEGGKLLEVYSDRAAVSAYATDSIAKCVKTGVVSGRENNTLAPKAYVTRAEVAVMAERLLQKSDLI
jgi:hypothetical protein